MEHCPHLKVVWLACRHVSAMLPLSLFAPSYLLRDFFSHRAVYTKEIIAKATACLEKSDEGVQVVPHIGLSVARPSEVFQGLRLSQGGNIKRSKSVNFREHSKQHPGKSFPFPRKVK